MVKPEVNYTDTDLSLWNRVESNEQEVFQFVFQCISTL